MSEIRSIPQVLDRTENGVLELVIANEERKNALAAEIYDGLLTQLRAGGNKGDVRCVVITGAGGTFCAGGDLQTLRQRHTLSNEERLAMFDSGLHGVIQAIRNCHVPVVAAVEGAAVGAGMSLALACDFIVASRATRFMTGYARIGLSPDGGMTHVLARNLPRHLANAICILGEPVSAEQLHAWGLVHSLSWPGGALRDARRLAQEIAAGPKSATSKIKRLLWEAQETTLGDQLSREAVEIVDAQNGWEVQEGTAAFLERRKPDFKSA